MEQQRKDRAVRWIVGIALYLALVSAASVVYYWRVASDIPFYGTVSRHSGGVDSLRSRGLGTRTKVGYWELRLGRTRSAGVLGDFSIEGLKIGSAVIKQNPFTTWTGMEFTSSDIRWAMEAAAEAADWAIYARGREITDALRTKPEIADWYAGSSATLIVVDAARIVRVRNYAAMATAAFVPQFATAVLLLLLGFFMGRAEEEKAVRRKRRIVLAVVVVTATFVGLLCVKAALPPQYMARITMLISRSNPEATRQRTTRTARQILSSLGVRESPGGLKSRMKAEGIPKWATAKVEVAPEPGDCEVYGDRVASEIQRAYAAAVLKADQKLPRHLTGKALLAAERPLVILEPPRAQPLTAAIVSAGVWATGRAALGAILCLLGFVVSGLLAQRRQSD